MTTTEGTNISELLNLSAAFGDFADEYDVDAVLADYVAALDEAAGEGVYVTASGVVYAELDRADHARQLGWKALADGIDLLAIMERHER